MGINQSWVGRSRTLTATGGFLPTRTNHTADQLSSIDVVAEIDQQLVGGFKMDQACSGILDV